MTQERWIKAKRQYPFNVLSEIFHKEIVETYPEDNGLDKYMLENKLRQFLAVLPQDLRYVFELHFKSELTIAEIAQQENLQECIVQDRIALVLNHLRHPWQREFWTYETTFCVMPNNQSAQDNIPFDMFFDWYFTGRRCNPTKMLPNQSDTERRMVESEFLRRMETVTFEDLASLTDEGLNCVPMPWLYDWLHVHGFHDHGMPEQFVDNLYVKRKEYDKIGFDFVWKAKTFAKQRKQFTFKQMQTELQIDRAHVLGVMYRLFIDGYVRYVDGVYVINKYNKFLE